MNTQGLQREKPTYIKFHEEKVKYTKFIKDMNQDTLGFLKKNPHGNWIHEEKNQCTNFTREKSTCNKFSEEEIKI